MCKAVQSYQSGLFGTCPSWVGWHPSSGSSGYDHCESLPCRRDALRFLKAIDGEKFADGLRQALSDDEIAQAFWLSTGFPPQLRLKDLRAKDRGELKLVQIQMAGT